MALVATVSWSCTNEKQKSGTESKVETQHAAVVDGHNAQNSLDWAGTYQSVQPCADCEGIEVILTLNKDQTYIRKSTYLGVKAKNVPATEEKGTFEWDESGLMIQLSASSDAGPNRYRVGENQIIQLDMDGKQIEGPHAALYVLKKQ